MAYTLVLESTPYAVAAALLVVFLLWWRLKPAAFRSLTWQSLALASGLFWGMLAAGLIFYAWEFYYQHFVPDWYRFAAPLGALGLYALIGLGLRWLALRLPGNPAVNFCLLGGLEALPEHLVAIYRFDILHIPILRGSRPGAILLFAWFEYVVYWGLALLLAVILDRMRTLLRSGKRRQAA